MIGFPFAAGGTDVEGVGVGIDGQAEELAADRALKHLPYVLVFGREAQVGPDLGPAVPQPHRVDVARVDEGVGMPVLIGLGEMDGGVQGVGETVAEHPRKARVGQQTLDFLDLGLDGGGREEAVLRNGTVVDIALRLVRTVPDRFFGAHLQDEFAAGHDVLIADERLGVWLSVEPDAADVLVVCADAGSLDGEGLAFRKGDFGLLEEGRAEPVAAAGRLDLIEAHRGKDVPGRHLAGIFVAGKAVGLVGIELGHDLTDQVCGLPGLAEHGVEVQDVVARLVAVGILADQAGNV